MTYSLIIPEHLVREMSLIREKTGTSIRQQIIKAIEVHIDEKEQQEIEDTDSNSLTFKPIDERTSRLFNTKTGRFHSSELGIDVVY